ncbi:histidine kinase [Streptomyces albus subsp. albus]|nr:histidine kinase [Streptomyces albus subsp. albus]
MPWTGVVRRRFGRIPAGIVDALLAAGFIVVSLLLGHDNAPAPWRRLDAAGSVLTCVVNLPVAVRRRAPVAVCVTVLLLWTGYIACGYWPVVNSLAPLLALYTVAATRPLRTAVGCSALLAAVWNYAGWTGQESGRPTVLGQSVLYPAILCWFGSIARTADARNIQLAELTERLRREQDDKARRAVAAERVRIARELHDVVAHHMAVISVQANLAGYVFTSDPATARTALSTIAGTSSDALEEMRRLLMLLRVDPADEDDTRRHRPEDRYAPTPGLDRLPELLDRVRGAGVPVELTVTGRRRPLASGVELCAHRVVQESLTNVVKHAPPGATAAVELGYGAEVLTVRVRNDGGQTGRGRKPAIPLPSTGHGLMSMRERARIYGGGLTVGPLPGGGFEVTLTLPALTAASRSTGERTTDDGEGTRRR